MPRSAGLSARGLLPFVPVDLAWHANREDGLAPLLKVSADPAVLLGGAVGFQEFGLAVEDYADAEPNFCPDIRMGVGYSAESNMLPRYWALPEGGFVFDDEDSGGDLSVGEDEDSEGDASSMS